MQRELAPADIDLSALQSRIGYVFRQPQLLVNALTHRSYCHEQPTPTEDNERLEFLGDAVVGCAVSALLCRRYPRAAEGELTRYRALLVNSTVLAFQAEAEGIGKALRLGRGEESTGGRQKTSVLADAFEAVAGAVFIDGGFDAAKAWVERCLAPAVERVQAEAQHRQFKVQFQEAVQGEVHLTPRYRIASRSGEVHAPLYEVEVTVADEVVGRGEGASKKAAEEAAAQQAFERLQSGEITLGVLARASGS